jgi:hypothetical protein
MLPGYLLMAPGFAALDAAPPRRTPQDGRISVLDEAEQRRIRWLEGHLIELETGCHPEGSARAAYDPDLHSVEERELAKLAGHASVLTQDSLPAPRILALRSGWRAAAEPGCLPRGCRRTTTPRPDNVAKRPYLRDARLRDRKRLSSALMADRIPPILVSPAG